MREGAESVNTKACTGHLHDVDVVTRIKAYCICTQNYLAKTDSHPEYNVYITYLRPAVYPTGRHSSAPKH